MNSLISNGNRFTSILHIWMPRYSPTRRFLHPVCISIVTRIPEMSATCTWRPLVQWSLSLSMVIDSLRNRTHVCLDTFCNGFFNELCCLFSGACACNDCLQTPDNDRGKLKEGSQHLSSNSDDKDASQYKCMCIHIPMSRFIATTTPSWNPCPYHNVLSINR